MIHLELYSEYSIKFGITDLESVVDACVADQQKALALTDYHNLFAWIKFYQYAKKRGIKPICGMRIDLYQEPDCSILVLCANQRGYEQLMHYCTTSYTSGMAGRWPLAWLTRAQLSGLWVILLPPTQTSQRFEKVLTTLHAELGSQLLLAIQRADRPHDDRESKNQYLRAHKHGLSVVATHPICFLKAEDFEAHEIRVCIQESQYIDDPHRPQLYSPKQHWLSQQDMHALWHDAPRALEHSVQIAAHCNLSVETGVYHLPKIVPPQDTSLIDYFKQLAHDGLHHRLQQRTHPYPLEEYHTRLDYEIDIIATMGFISYFLIVSDFIQWAKKNGIPVGPGRGSGAGSLASYVLGITDLDPLEYQLLFERFLNPERVSMPDFDIDFCMIDRDKVIQYVTHRYGADCVSQIITYGTMAAKAVIRDVGRVLGHPYGMVDSIAKLVPFELGITLDKALSTEPALKERYDRDEEVRQLIDIAKKLEGKVRNAGRHAGGVVIAPRALDTFSPLYVDDPQDMPMTHFDKDDLETIGLVKFDFLGLRTLTLLRWATDILAEHEILLDLNNLSLTDRKTYQILTQGQTLGVFQLESSGMRELVMRLAPDCMEDLIALVALYRPGPLQSGMVDDFIERKHGALVRYPHPLCEPILKPTYGVIVYQEQVMQIAQVIAGYSLGGADLLRRAMGKKKADEMAAQRSIFAEGAAHQGLDAQESGELFDLIEKFAGYGFNKSHSAAYALISYQTAYIKAHYPDIFMAAVLSSEIDHPEKLVFYAREVTRMSLVLLPPCVFESKTRFHVPLRGHIRYGLGAIKGVGLDLSEHITQDAHLKTLNNAREWVSYAQQHYRVGRKTFEALVKSGAMDALHPDRGSLWASIDRHLSSGAVPAPARRDLFDDVGHDRASAWLCEDPWSGHERLMMEAEALGWYMSGHPATAFRKEAQTLGVAHLGQISDYDSGHYWTVAIVKQVRRMMSRGGKRLCFWTLEDEHTQIEAGLFEETAEFRQWEQSPMPLLMRLEVRVREQRRRYVLTKILSVPEIRRLQPPEVRISLPPHLSEALSQKLAALLTQHPGPSELHWRWQKMTDIFEWRFGSIDLNAIDFLKILELSGCSYDIRYPSRLQ